MDCAYASIACPSEFSGLEGLFVLLGTLTATICTSETVAFWLPRKARRVHRAEKTVQMYTACLEPIVSATFTPSDVHPTESGHPVPESGSQSISGAEEVTQMEVDTTGKISYSDDVQPMEVYPAVSWTSTTDEEAQRSVPASNFSSTNYESVEIVENIGQIREVPYSFREILERHKEKLRIFINRRGLDYTGDVLTVTLCITPKGDNKSVEALLGADSIHKRLKTLIQVVMDVERHRFAALSQPAPCEDVYE